MFLKFSILLLSILAANTVLGASEDENEPDQTEVDNILKDLYEDCRKWLGGSRGEVPSAGVWMYMGKNKSDLNRIFEYYKNNPDVPQDHLELKHFSDLFKYICGERGVTIKYWAAYRKTKAALMTLDEIAGLRPERSEDNYRLRVKTDEEILNNSFDNCRRWLGDSQKSTISLSEFWIYMGKNEKDNERISNFFIKNPNAHFRILEYYTDDLDAIQGPIDFKLYCELFKHICSEAGVPVWEWAAYRELKVAARSLGAIISLPRGDHDKAL